MSTDVISRVRDDHRRLATILCVEIDDHSYPFGIDEESARERIERHRREIIAPAIAHYNGRLVNNIGESFFTIFESPFEAVRCAMAMRQSLVRWNASLPRQTYMQCRVGVCLTYPDTIHRSVNVAAWLQSLAEPGTIYVSGGVCERVRKKLGCRFQSLGVHKLEDIADPLPVYSVLPNSSAVVRQAQPSWSSFVIAVGVALAVGSVAGWYRLHANSSTQTEEPPAVIRTEEPPGIPQGEKSLPAMLPLPAQPRSDSR